MYDSSSNYDAAAKMRQSADKYKALAQPYILSSQFSAYSGDLMGSIYTANEGAMALLDNYLNEYSSTSIFSSPSPKPVETRDVQAEQEAKAKAEQEAKAKAEQEAKAKAEQEAKASAEQEAEVKAEQEAKTKAEEEAKAKEEQETKSEVTKTVETTEDKKPVVSTSYAFTRRNFQNKMDKVLDPERKELARLEQELKDAKGARHTNDKGTASQNNQAKIEQLELDIRAQKTVIEQKRRECYETFYNQLEAADVGQSEQQKSEKNQRIQQQIDEVDKQIAQLNSELASYCDMPSKLTEIRGKIDDCSKKKADLESQLNAVGSDSDFDDATYARALELQEKITQIETDMKNLGYDRMDAKIPGIHPIIHGKQDKWIKYSKELNDILIGSVYNTIK